MEKDRVTHDQFFPGAFSDTSVKGRVINKKLLPCFYGNMNWRTIHYTVRCRMRHPRRWIWISKIDWKSAYCRQHLNAKTAIKSLTQLCIKGITLLLAALRLTFGGNPFPSEWRCISKTIVDLATDILHCGEWDPSEMHSPLQHMMPEPKPLPPHIPFAPSKSLIVALPPEDHGKVDVYIDDTVAIGPCLPGIIPRLAACILLSFHLVFCPLSKFEPIPLNKAAAVAKLLAEGGLEETKQILGWLYDTGRLLISLPASVNSSTPLASNAKYTS